MSYVLTYLIVGVVFVALYDYMCSKLETDNRFTNRERVIVVFLWPVGVVMLIWSFIQVMRNGPH